MAFTAAEKQARYRAKQKLTASSPVELADARAEIVRLKSALAAADVKIRYLNHELAQKPEQEATRAKLKAAKAASAVEFYANDDAPTLREKLQDADKQLASKAARVKTLTTELRDQGRRFDKTKMPLKTFGKVSKFLLGDPSPEALEAIQLLNEWRSIERKQRP